MWLYRTNIYYHILSVGQEFGSSLTGWFWFRVSPEIALNMLVGVQSSENLMGTRESASKLTHTAVAGDLSSLLWGPLHKAVHDMAAGFPQSELSEKERALCGGCSAFYNPNLRSDIASPLPYSIGHADHPWYNMERNYTKAWLPGGKNHWTLSRKHNFKTSSLHSLLLVRLSHLSFLYRNSRAPLAYRVPKVYI